MVARKRAAVRRTLGEIAVALGARLVGDGSLPIDRLVHPAAASSATDLAIAIEAGALRALADSSAKAAIVAAGARLPDDRLAGHIVVERPRYALAALVELFAPPIRAPAGIHATAAVDPTARIAASARIGAFVHVGPGAKIGRGTIVMPHVTIGAEASIGAACRLDPGVRIGERVRLGDRVIVQNNASIGADGFGYATPELGARRTDAGSTTPEPGIVRIASIGTVEIGDEVEIGACTTIDRGTIVATRIGRGTKIDNLVMVAHNTTIGESCLIAAQVGISGSCRIGDRVVLAGKVGIADHLAIGDDAIVLAGSGVMRDVAPGAIMFGYPAQIKGETFRQQVHMRRLQEMFDRLSDLAERMERLEAGLERGQRAKAERGRR